MFNNAAIDVALGLVFVFLLYSLLASIFQEMLARLLGLRARNLLKALRRMLQDGDSGVSSTVLNFFVDAGNNLVDWFRPMKDKTFLKAFYEFPAIKYLGENNTNSKPSYIDPDTFSTTVIQLLRGQGYNPSLNQMQVIRSNLATGKIDRFTINPQTLKTLSLMWVDAQNDIDRFKFNLEKWFTETMMRATGWYKKQTHLLLFVVGWGLAWQFNVDPIAISKILASNEGTRKELANLVLNDQKKMADLLKIQKDTVIVDAATKMETRIRYVKVSDEELKNLADQMKVDAQSVQHILGLGPRGKMNTKIKETYQNSDGVAYVGWLLTGFAISLGASFWFDLLNKIMLLRNAGLRPDQQESRTSGRPITPPVKPVG